MKVCVCVGGGGATKQDNSRRAIISGVVLTWKLEVLDKQKRWHKMFPPFKTGGGVTRCILS